MSHMRFQTFASSSSGNASLLSCGDTHILIDAGISFTRLRTCLRQRGLAFEDLSALLITHAHNDHIAGIATLCRRSTVPIRCSEETARQLSYRIAGVEPLLDPFPLGGEITVGDCRVRSIPTSHDCPGSTGFRFSWEGRSMGYLTDTGVLPREAEALLGTDLLLLEANHDIEALRSGPYPYYLKARVLGPQGHLSNDDAARFAREAAAAGTRAIILAHLSQENNTPQMALNTVSAALGDLKVALSAAPRREAGPVCQIDGQEVRVCCESI